MRTLKRKTEISADLHNDLHTNVCLKALPLLRNAIFEYISIIRLVAAKKQRVLRSVCASREYKFSSGDVEIELNFVS